MKGYPRKIFEIISVYLSALLQDPLSSYVSLGISSYSKAYFGAVCLYWTYFGRLLIIDEALLMYGPKMGHNDMLTQKEIGIFMQFSIRIAMVDALLDDIITLPMAGILLYYLKVYKDNVRSLLVLFKK